MTCQEAREFLNADIEHRTTAEIAAVVGHVIKCKECYEWHNAKHAAGKAEMTPAEYARERQRGKHVSKAIIKKIEADQEAMETIYGKVEK